MLNTTLSTGIVIFCFNRPQAIKRMLVSLRECPEIDRLPIFFCIDGARNDDEAKLVAEVVSIAEAFEHSNKAIYQRPTNQGLRSSLVKGISDVLLLYESVIVLEDDLELSPLAIDYFLRALSRYQNAQQIVSVCGYALGEEIVSDKNAVHFLPMTHPWGWATWRNRWLEHVSLVDIAPQHRSKSFGISMNVFGLRDYQEMLKLAEAGIINSWWIYWQLFAIRRHYLSVFPSSTYIRNDHLRSGGTHSSRWNFLNLSMGAKELCQVGVEFPNEIIVDFDEIERIRQTREASVLRSTGFLGGMRRKIVRSVRNLKKTVSTR